MTSQTSELVELMRDLHRQATEAYPQPLPEQSTRAAEAMAGRADMEAVAKWRARTDAAKQRITNLLPTLLERLSASEVTEEWLPIESAPKDGTLMLVIDEQGDYDIANWHRDHTCGLHFGCMKHTHWRPLPEPPRSAATSERKG